MVFPLGNNLAHEKPPLADTDGKQTAKIWKVVGRRPRIEEEIIGGTCCHPNRHPSGANDKCVAVRGSVSMGDVFGCDGIANKFDGSEAYVSCGWIGDTCWHCWLLASSSFTGSDSKRLTTPSSETAEAGAVAAKVERRRRQRT